MQTRHTEAVHKACKALWVNHVQPTHDVHATSSSTSGYDTFYSPMNPLLNTSNPSVGDEGVNYVADGVSTIAMNGYGQRPQE